MRIHIIDKLGLEGKNTGFQFGLNALPEPLFLVEPKPGAGIVDETLTFSWSENKAAKA